MVKDSTKTAALFHGVKLQQKYELRPIMKTITSFHILQKSF